MVVDFLPVPYIVSSMDGLQLLELPGGGVHFTCPYMKAVDTS